MICLRHQLRNRPLVRTVVSGPTNIPPRPDGSEARDNLSHATRHLAAPKAFKAIPGPGGIYQWPLIGTLLLYKPFSHFTPENSHKLFQHLFERFGPIVRLQLGAPTVLIYDPKDMEQMFSNEGRYPRRPTFSLTLTYNVRNGVKDSLADTDGENWQRLRTPLNKHLSRVNSADQYLGSQNLVAYEFAKNLVSSRGDAEEMREWFFRYSTECISLVCLNTRLGLLDSDVPIESDALNFLDETKNIFVQIQRVLSGKSIMHDYYLNKTYREYERSNSFVRSFIKSKLNRASARQDKQVDIAEKNLISSLLKEKELDSEDVENMMMTLYVAGMESTAKNLQVFFFVLASNPDKQEKLYKEIVDVAGETGEVTSEILRSMPYLRACLKESFRLRYPSLTGPARVLQDDAVIRGFNIPAGTQILPCNSYTCKTVFREADKFLPERWMRSESDRKLAHDNPPLACLPFGYGPRNCIGRRFAEQQIYLAAIKTLQRAKIKLRAESSMVTFSYAIFIEPSKAIAFEFIPRG